MPDLVLIFLLLAGLCIVGWRVYVLENRLDVVERWREATIHLPGTMSWNPTKDDWDIAGGDEGGKNDA